MKLRATVRDALYLNWALPLESLPPAPAPLRYELHSHGGEDFVFASAVLFRQQGVRVPLLPLARLSYPQLSFRLSVLDTDRIPSVLFLHHMVPGWIYPGARLAARRPLSWGRLDFPRPSRDPEAREWTWTVQAGGSRAERLEVRARPGSPGGTEVPRPASWEALVKAVLERPRGYAVVRGTVRRLEAETEAQEVWPLATELGDVGLLTSFLPEVEPGVWSRPHSAWLCPRMPVVLELAGVPEISLPEAVPAGRTAAVPGAERSAAQPDSRCA